MTRVVLILLASVLLVIPVSGKVMFEVGFHYSVWNVDMIAPLLEDEVVPEIEYWDPEYGNLSFTSDGNNFGFEIRFFPWGEDSSFSMGLSYERNNFKMRADGVFDGYDDNGNAIQAEAEGTIDLLPHSFNFSVRFELWPSKRVHPFIGFGAGFGVQDILVKFHSKVTTDEGGVILTQEQDEVFTTQDVLDEYEKENGKKFPIGFFPVIHINFGFTGEVFNNTYLLGEVAFYDGLIFRAGVSYRF